MADTILDIAGVGPALDKVHEKLLPGIHRGVATEFALWAHGEAVRRYPVGTLGTRHKDPKQRQRQTSPHPGKARASNTVSAGSPEYPDLPDQPAYQIPGDGEARAGLTSLRYADDIWLSNDAKNSRSDYNYPSTLEEGRRKSASGGMTGSEQAEDGVYRPLQEEAPAELDRILTGVFRRVSEVAL